MPPFFRGSMALALAQSIGEHGPRTCQQINEHHGTGVATRSALRWLKQRGFVEVHYSLTRAGVAALSSLQRWEYDESLARKLKA